MDNDLVPRRRLALFGAAMFSLTAIVSLALFVAASKDKDPATLVIDGTVSGQLGQGSSPGGPDSLPSSSSVETMPSTTLSDLTPIDVATTTPSTTTPSTTRPSTTKPSTVTTIQAPPPSKAPPTTKPPTTTTKPPSTTTPTSGLPINPPTPTGATLVEDDWGSPGSFKMIWEVSADTFTASRTPVLDYVKSKGCTITDTSSGTFSCGNGVTGYASLNAAMEASAPDKVILHYSVTW